MVGDPSRPVRSVTGRRAARLAWLAGMLACLTIAAAWAGWRLWRLSRPVRPDARAETPRLGQGGEESGWLAPWSTSGPGDVGPGAAAGLQPLDRDPPETPPPPGARRLWAFRRRSGGVEEWQARYECGGSVEDLVRHYRRTLGEANYTLRTDRPASAPAGGRTLVFLRGKDRAVVDLHKDPPNAKMRQVAVTVIRPAS